MAKIKVRLKQKEEPKKGKSSEPVVKKTSPDPEKKYTLPSVTVTGVRKKPTNLPDVTVTGTRKKPTNLPDVTVTGKRKGEPEKEKMEYTMSDEYKAILWDTESRRYGRGRDADENKLGRIEGGAPDYNYSEGYYKKKGKEGKMWVRYSDGTIHKLGEKYTPKENKIKPASGKSYPGGGKSWLEWYQSRREGKEDDFSDRKDIKQ
jgi:hypothetical protein